MPVQTNNFTNAFIADSSTGSGTTSPPSTKPPYKDSPISPFVKKKETVPPPPPEPPIPPSLTTSPRDAYVDDDTGYRAPLGQSTQQNSPFTRTTNANENVLVNDDTGIRAAIDPTYTFPDDNGRAVDNSDLLFGNSAKNHNVAKTADDTASLVRDLVSRLTDALYSFKDKGVKEEKKSFDLSYFQALDTQAATINVKLPEKIKLAAVNSFTSQEQGDSFSNNTTRPILTKVHVGINSKEGVGDFHTATLTFNMSLSDVESGNIKAIRIFRAKRKMVQLDRPQSTLSQYALNVMSPNTSRTSVVNDSSVGELSIRLDESNVHTDYNTTMTVDEKTGLRTTQKPITEFDLESLDSATRSQQDNRVYEDVKPYVNPLLFGSIDKSVAEHLPTLRSLQIQNSDFKTVPLVDAATAGDVLFGDEHVKLQQAQINDVKSAFDKIDGRFSITKDNDDEYQEIAFLTPAKLNSKIIGNYIYYSHKDVTVLFGNTYSYYVVTVDGDLDESVRSNIVNVTIDGMRVPSKPKSVNSYTARGTITLSILSDDDMVEKFEIFRKSDIDEVDVNQYNKMTASIDNNKETVKKDTYICLGIINNQINSGGIYIDKQVKVGTLYTYRVYSVDIFGNKSESPREIEVYYPTSDGKVLLRKPVITVETDQTTGNVKILMSCDDIKVKTLFLAKRDLTAGQTAFTTPSQPSRLDITLSKKVPLILKDEDTSLAWNGKFETNGATISFIDKTTQFDRSYQYSLYGIDRFGNKTPSVVSNIIFVARRPIIAAPSDLSAAAVLDDTGTLLGITVKWNHFVIDTPVEDKLGSQFKLKNSAVRTAFQVERREVGSDKWDQFPMVTDKVLFDDAKRIDSKDTAGYPTTVRMNNKYLYRVMAFQSGNVISNFTDPVLVETVGFLPPPLNFTVRVPSTKISPFFVMLNWNDNKTSAKIDRWEIQKADVNNLFAENLNSKGNLLDKLPWYSFREVYKESSRFRSLLADTELDIKLRNTLIVGENHYMDAKILFGNTYFYRIRSIGIDNSVSSWEYASVKVTDASFENVFDAVVTAEKKRKLSEDKNPISDTSDFDPSNTKDKSNKNDGHQDPNNGSRDTASDNAQTNSTGESSDGKTITPFNPDALGGKGSGKGKVLKDVTTSTVINTHQNSVGTSGEAALPSSRSSSPAPTPAYAVPMYTPPVPAFPASTYVPPVTPAIQTTYAVTTQPTVPTKQPSSPNTSTVGPVVAKDNTATSTVKRMATKGKL